MQRDAHRFGQKNETSYRYASCHGEQNHWIDTYVNEVTHQNRSNG